MWKDFTQLALAKHIPIPVWALSGNNREMGKKEAPLSRNSESSKEERKTDSKDVKERR